MLLLFAAQAAAAIGNARAHRRERRARRDLEGLVETTPVGVVVFDGRSGEVVSSNREARRIGGRLRMPGRPLEELLKIMACRRADGREVSLEAFPLAEQFENAETVRAEEVVLSVPDGRDVRMLINATPIPAEGKVAGSVVVTMQDLEPLEEIERLRTEFLGLVSHELRVPLTAIKGSATTRRTRPGSSTTAVWATACRDPPTSGQARANPTRKNPKNRDRTRPAAPDRSLRPAPPVRARYGMAWMLSRRCVYLHGACVYINTTLNAVFETMD